jgi:DNA-binding transcriptional MerR regulator
VRIDTVRYYEKSGLLTPRLRLPSGYRRYGATELSRLRFIRRAQALGFTLSQGGDEEAPCHVRQSRERTW